MGHERMHRTLKAETDKPPAGNRGVQKRRFNRFHAVYNEEFAGE
jgi:putative transposase